MSASRGPFDFGASNYSVRKTLRRRYDPTGINYKTLLGQSSKPQVQQKFQRYRPDVNPLAQDMASPEGAIEPTPARKVELLKDFYKNKMTALQEVYDDLPTVAGPNGTVLDVTRSNHFKSWLQKKAEAKGELVPAEGSSKYYAMANTYTRVIDAKMQAYSSIIAQLNASGGAEAVLDAYLRGFHCFLRGRPTEEHQRKLKKLGLKPTFEPFRQESVQQYLKAFSRVKKEYYEDLAMLRMQGPTGDLHQIELYYKYIVDGKEDEKIEQNLWHWLEGGKLPKHTGRLLGKGASHTSLVTQLSTEFPVGTREPEELERAGNRLGGGPPRGGGGGFNPGPGGGGGGAPPRDDDDQPPGGGDEGPKISPSQQSFLDTVRQTIASALGIKSEPVESAEQVLEKEKEALDTALLESRVDEQIREVGVQQAARNTGVAYVLAGGAWPEDPATGVPDWADMSEEGRNLVHDVAQYRDMAREAMELREHAEKLQEKFPKEAAMAAEQYDDLVSGLLEMETHLEPFLSDREKQGLFTSFTDNMPVDTTDADDDDDTGQVTVEAEPEAENLKEQAGAESDDEKEPLTPVKKKDKGKEREELPRIRDEEELPPGVEESSWERAQKRIDELKDAAPETAAAPSKEDKELEDRVRDLGAKIGKAEAAESSEEAIKALEAAPAVPSAAPGEQALPKYGGASEAAEIKDEGTAFDASLAQVISDLFPEPPGLVSGKDSTKTNIDRVNAWVQKNQDNAIALIEASLPQVNSGAAFASYRQPMIEDTLAQLDKAEAILKSAVENGEDSLKMSWDEFKQSSDKVYERMVQRGGSLKDIDDTLWLAYENKLAPVRKYAAAQFAHLSTVAANEVRNNDAAWINSLQRVLRNEDAEWKKKAQSVIIKNKKRIDKLNDETKRVFDAQNETARVVNKVTDKLIMEGIPVGDESEPSEAEMRLHETANEINRQMAEKFINGVNDAIARVNATAERAIADASSFVIGKVPEEVQKAIMEAQKQALIFTGQAVAVKNAVAPIQKAERTTKTLEQRRAAEKNEPKSRLYNPDAGWLRSTRRVEQRDRNEAEVKSHRAKAIEKARKLPDSFSRPGPIEKKKIPESFSAPYKKFTPKVKREKMSEEEEDRVTRGY